MQRWLGIAIAIALLRSSSCRGVTLRPRRYSLFRDVVFCTKVGQQRFSLPLFILLRCASCRSVSLQVTRFFFVPRRWHVSCLGIGDCVAHRAAALATAFHGLAAASCVMPRRFSSSCGIFRSAAAFFFMLCGFVLCPRAFYFNAG